MILRPQTTPILCPCGTGQPFGSCCQLYLKGVAIAPTAEALMRSRYSAFATEAIDYLIQTHHPSRRTLNERNELKTSCRNTTWQKLWIVQTSQGQKHDLQGMVEFIAVYRTPETELAQLHERSQFVQESGQWFYVDGEMLPPFQPQRGAPCWCGSGEKYKRCHG